jgi:hypothetical protein
MRSALIVLIVVAIAYVAVGARQPEAQPRSGTQSAEKAKERAVAQVLEALGKAAKFSGSDCPDGEQMVNIYLEEIGRRPAVSLSETVPRFAKRAAAICPKSQPTITPGNQVDVSKVAAILGLANPPQDGTIALDSWLELTVAYGKVVTLTIVLEKMPR